MGGDYQTEEMLCRKTDPSEPNCLNNGSFANNKRFDRLSSGARRDVTGGDVRGIDRDRAAEALRDRKVERTKPDAGVIDPASSVFGGACWGARAMVNLFKVKSITAMFRGLPHGNPESATTIREFIMSGAPPSMREVYAAPEGIRSGPARVAEKVCKQGRAGRGRGRKQSSTRMPFNLESKRHEQKSRGFAGL